MTNPLDEQRAAHVEALRNLQDAADRDECFNISATLGALMERTAPPLCAKGEVCGECKGRGFHAWAVGQTPETFEQGESECPDCNGTGHTTPAQPRREVTDADAKRAWKAYMDSSDPNGLGAMKAALESFANGGDGNG